MFGPYEGSKEGKQVKGKKSVKQVKEAGYAWEVKIIQYHTHPHTHMAKKKTLP